MVEYTNKSIATKRCLLWDWTNTRDRPSAIDQLFAGSEEPGYMPFKSVHNWNAWYPTELAGRLPFRPMTRTREQLETEQWSWICASDAEIVHYFNEPERQSISAADAATWWLATVVPELRTKRKKQLIGPSCASDEGGSAWLAEFMRLVRDQPPDYLGVHYYSGDVPHAKKYITGMHKAYGLPLVVSEIGSISRDESEVVKFTEELSDWMDQQEWIIEYGWFGCMAQVADDFVSPAAQLMDKDGKFTPLMRRLLARRDKS